jgi:T5SS/PEP-CTERM-associated repeat protein
MANTYRRFIQTELTSASFTNVLTVADETTAIVKSVIVSNDDSAVTASITMSVAPSGSGTLTIEPAKDLLPKTSEDLLLNKGPLVLQSSDILKVKGTGGSPNVDVVASALLVDRN